VYACSNAFMVTSMVRTVCTSSLLRINVIDLFPFVFTCSPPME
jgi:hypothetical protein